MKRHYKRIHDTKNWAYECTVCGFFESTEDKNLFSNHIRTHADARVQLNLCVVYVAEGYVQPSRCTQLGCHYQARSAFHLGIHAARSHSVEQYFTRPTQFQYLPPPQHAAPAYTVAPNLVQFDPLHVSGPYTPLTQHTLHPFTRPQAATGPGTSSCTPCTRPQAATGQGTSSCTPCTRPQAATGLVSPFNMSNTLPQAATSVTQFAPVIAPMSWKDIPIVRDPRTVVPTSRAPTPAVSVIRNHEDPRSPRLTQILEDLPEIMDLTLSCNEELSDVEDALETKMQEFRNALIDAKIISQVKDITPMLSFKEEVIVQAAPVALALKISDGHLNNDQGQHVAEVKFDVIN